MQCRRTRAAPSAPVCIIHFSELNSSHFWVMLSFMEKGFKLDELGEKSLLVVLKSRTRFLCYFYMPPRCLCQRSLVPTKESQRKASNQKRCNMTANTACTAQVLFFRDFQRTQGRMMMQPREDKCNLRNACPLSPPKPSLFTAITRGTQISVPWYHHLPNGKSTVSPPGMKA